MEGCQPVRLNLLTNRNRLKSLSSQKWRNCELIKRIQNEHIFPPPRHTLPKTPANLNFEMDLILTSFFYAHWFQIWSSGPICPTFIVGSDGCITNGTLAQKPIHQVSSVCLSQKLFCKQTKAINSHPQIRNSC